MKRFLTIPLAFLILLSGMHFTVATHYCGGYIAATRLSFSGKPATCGMLAVHNPGNLTETQVSSKCCDDRIAVYKTDHDYAPSAFHLKDHSQHNLQEFFIPLGFSFHSSVSPLISYTNDSPPGCFMANAVRIADICVFRI
jgi:hypothetical protein